MRKALRYGSVQVQFSFDDQRKLLHCAVIAGKDLLPCDINGLSDPFVVLEFRMDATSEKRHFSKSPVKFNTLAPSFMYDVQYDLSDLPSPAAWRLHLELWSDAAFLLAIIFTLTSTHIHIFIETDTRAYIHT